MTVEVEIKYIHKNPRNDARHPIESVGGTHGSQSWKFALPVAVAHAKNGTYKFFTYVRGFKTWVVVAKSAWGNEYLKTEKDSTVVDNLLSLPEFPYTFSPTVTA